MENLRDITEAIWKIKAGNKHDLMSVSRGSVLYRGFGTDKTSDKARVVFEIKVNGGIFLNHSGVCTLKYGGVGRETMNLRDIIPEASMRRTNR